MDLTALDTGYLAFFVGTRVNALVMQRLAEHGFADIKESDGYLIQHLVEGPRSISELARRMGVSQQAASKTVADMKRRKLLTVRVGEDTRARDVALARRGEEVLAEARKARHLLDKRLAATCSATDLARLRKALVGMLEELGGADAVRERRVRPA